MIASRTNVAMIYIVLIFIVLKIMRYNKNNILIIITAGVIRVTVLHTVATYLFT